MKTQSGNIQAIDLMRSVAILYVMAAHATVAMASPEMPLVQSLGQLFARNAVYGVSIFFVISGFLITRLMDEGPGGILNPDRRWFYTRRIGRIFPLWTLSILFGAEMVYFFRSEQVRYLYCFLPHHSLLDFKFWMSFPTLTFNWLTIFREGFSYYGLHWSVMWSLAIEEQFYLVYPWALKKCGSVSRLTRGLLVVVAVGLVFRAGCYFYDSGSSALPMFSSFAGFEGIAMGALCYLLYSREKQWLGVLRNGGWGIGWVGLGLMLYAFSFTETSVHPFCRVYGSTLMEMGTCFFFWGFLDSKFLNWKGWRAFTWPGRYSYGLYLMHATTLYFLYPTIHMLPLWKAFGIYVGSSLAVAALSYRFFELPCNLAIRGWLGKGTGIQKPVLDIPSVKS
jgi:peptidoglycan/LPS O-acetylase OafA/YrhL